MSGSIPTHTPLMPSLRKLENFTFILHYLYIRGPGQSSRYSHSLWAGRSGDRIPVEARFSAPVHTGPEPHKATSTMGTGLIPGIKRPGRGVNHPPPYSVEEKGRVELHFQPPLGFHGPLEGEICLLFTYLFEISL